MSNGNGHRWSKFWWGDWQNDPALRICGLAAQGLWMRLLCLMHEAERVGYLLINGRQPTNRQLASLVGAREKEIAELMHELLEAGVYSVTDDGVIFCRRMVKDAASSEAGREHVEKRWRARDPNRDPNRGATRKPNGEASRDPITRSLEAEEEAERRPPVAPHDVGGGAPRANGTNPRATGTNPRANGTQQPAARPQFRNGFITLALEEWQAKQPPGDPAEVADFIAARGLRYGTH